MRFTVPDSGSCRRGRRAFSPQGSSTHLRVYPAGQGTLLPVRNLDLGGANREGRSTTLLGYSRVGSIHDGRARLTGNHALGGNRNKYLVGDIKIELRERRQRLGFIDRILACAAVMPVSWAYGYARPWRHEGSGLSADS